jgi:type IV fimbrial biogenesis protein FimT
MLFCISAILNLSQNLGDGRSDMRSRGFTLIELMITIAIAAILLMLGPPSMRQLSTSSSVDQQSSTLFNSLHSARGQAVALNQDVVLCYATSTNICATSGFTHLLMFVDKSADGVLQVGNADPDVILISGGVLDNNVSITSPRTSYQFTNEGLVRSSGATFTLYNNDYGCTARKIILSVSGKAQICKSSDAGTRGCPTGNYCP